MFRPSLLLLTAVSLSMVGCGDSDANATPEPEPVEVPKPAKAKKKAKSAKMKVKNQTPQELYDECKERVEKPQKEGECKTDADCAKAGCSSEVCTTSKAAKNVMSACDARTCYQVLDTCGCNEGQCTWSIKSKTVKTKGPVKLE